MKKLPVWRTVKAANVFVFTNMATFWRIAIIPMCVYFVLYFIWYVAVGKEVLNSLQANADPVVSLWLFVPIIILSFLTISFVVSWHRLVLLGADAIVTDRGLKFERREFRFLLKGFVVTIILAIASTLAIMFAGIIGTVISATLGGLVPGFFVFLASIFFFVAALAPIYRYFLVIPAICIDGNASFGAAWKLGKGNSYRFFWTVFLASIPFAILVTVIGLVIGASLGFVLAPENAYQAATILGKAIEMFYFFAIGAIGATTLSMSYRFLTEAKAETAEMQEGS